jgi:hypothetical protein
MLVTVQKFREYVKTELTDSQIEEKLTALEYAIRKATNNNFQQRNRRSLGNINNGLTVESPVFKAGETIEISESYYNNGLYVIESIDESGNITLKPNDDLINEDGVLVTKIKYPPDVQMGAIEALKWKLKNELQNSGDKSQQPVQSESLSRHSVSYASDSTEYDIDLNVGVPKKFTSFLQPYIKARF